MKLKVGDIAILWGTGLRRLVVDSRDEIVSAPGENSKGYHLRTVYRLAGKEYSNSWFTNYQVSPIIPR